MTMRNKKGLSPEQSEELLKILKTRFEKNMHRHKDLEWSKIQTKLETNPEKLWSLNEMEETSPKGRRSVCYDLESLESRKEHRPKNSAIVMAFEMGI